MKDAFHPSASCPAPKSSTKQTSCPQSTALKFWEVLLNLEKQFDYAKMIKKKTDLLALMSKNNRKKCEDLGMKIYSGFGKVIDKNTVEITDS